MCLPGVDPHSGELREKSWYGPGDSRVDDEQAFAAKLCHRNRRAGGKRMRGRQYRAVDLKVI